MSSPIESLIQLFSRLPGFGPKSARRAVLYLLKRRESLMLPLIEAMEKTSQQIAKCSVCGNIGVVDPCEVCRDSTRDRSLICVVEDVDDLWALERSRVFRGLYHVLGGTLSALEGVRPTDLGIDNLIRRIKEEKVREVIIATGATLEGQTTAYYVAELFYPLGVKISRLAQGLPIGGELDYMDEGTLTAAFQARQELKV